MKKALLIGINSYPTGNELKGCIEDIHQVAAALERNGDGSPNFEVLMLEDVQTSAKAMDAIEQLFTDNGSDTALLYFSGHGFVNTTGAEIVMPHDIESGTQYYTGIQMSSIMDIVNKSTIRNKVIILDCCHSGNMGKYKLEATGSILEPGVSILTACRDDEYAEEAGGHGLFTEQLCNALNGGAADYCGNITIGGIYAYIDRTFGPWAQRPVFKTNVSAFAPLKTVKPQVSMEIIRQLTTLFASPDEEFALDPSFEDTNDPTIEHKWVEPYATKENVTKFKILQKLQSIGFVKPVGEEFMYFAAMRSKSCKLTDLGRYYWRLVNDGKI